MTHEKLKILFLGAGKLLSLLEYFIKAGQKQSIELEFFSFELDEFCPIGKVANVIKSPKFNDINFKKFLISFIVENKIDIVIPTMDSATVVLSSIKKELKDLGCMAVVSEYNLCYIMNDKILSEHWFKENDINHPINSTSFPKIAKPKLGYAAKGISYIKNQEDLQIFSQRVDLDEYLIQDFIDSDEYTVDAYVDNDGNIIDILTRQRIEIEAGIVNKSISRKNDSIIDITKTILSIPGWFGPITLQFFCSKNNPIIIEINPRFGGGVTHSLYCGLDMPTWIINEFFSKSIEHIPYNWKAGVLMTRCRRDIFYDHCH
ncbi:carbamoyl phosphate synthase-like protein (plasmid) [Rickettsiales bacterium Ac37b]|nr:carbamoyl phosphate synthase-like protein [Rickettsiales bacterium Ac37b]